MQEYFPNSSLKAHLDSPLPLVASWGIQMGFRDLLEITFSIHFWQATRERKKPMPSPQPKGIKTMINLNTLNLLDTKVICGNGKKANDCSDCAAMYGNGSCGGECKWVEAHKKCLSEGIYTANVYGALRGVCRFSLQYLWKRAVRITEKTLYSSKGKIVGKPCNIYRLPEKPYNNYV